MNLNQMRKASAICWFLITVTDISSSRPPSVSFEIMFT